MRNDAFAFCSHSCARSRGAVLVDFVLPRRNDVGFDRLQIGGTLFVSIAYIIARCDFAIFIGDNFDQRFLYRRLIGLSAQRFHQRMTGELIRQFLH
ncbi:MAG: hypothetical protein ACREJM_14365, partial [Candidatus Saccharimonadales bacterium]